MIGRNKAIFAGIFFSVFVLIGAAVAVIVAFKQNTEKPVAPTVPQISPLAAEPATTVACALTFKVEGPPTYKYKTCGVGINNARVCKEEDCNPKTADCSSRSTCSTDADCQTNSYRVCENNACVSRACNPANKPCDSLTSCQTDFDCRAITYKHAVCLGQSCKSVDCSPPTQPCDSLCKNNVDCGYVPPTHKECRNRACVVVTGAGVDKCTSDVTCQPPAALPTIPRSGNAAATIGAIVLGVGAVIAGLLILL